MRGTGSGFFRSCGGCSAQCHVRGGDKLTWLGKFLSDSPGLPSVPCSLLCGFLVRLVLDSVLIEVWVVQVLFQRVNEGNRRLFLRVRLELHKDKRQSDMFEIWDRHSKEVL